MSDGKIDFKGEEDNGQNKVEHNQTGDFTSRGEEVSMSSDDGNKGSNEDWVNNKGVDLSVFKDADINKEVSDLEENEKTHNNSARSIFSNSREDENTIQTEVNSDENPSPVEEESVDQEDMESSFGSSANVLKLEK